jgi:hypothetical protein
MPSSGSCCLVDAQGCCVHVLTCCSICSWDGAATPFSTPSSCDDRTNNVFAGHPDRRLLCRRSRLDGPVKTSLREQGPDVLRNAVTSGEIAPGTHLVETELSAALSIRGALDALGAASGSINEMDKIDLDFHLAAPKSP